MFRFAAVILSNVSPCPVTCSIFVPRYIGLRQLASAPRHAVATRYVATVRSVTDRAHPVCAENDDGAAESAARQSRAEHVGIARGDLDKRSISGVEISKSSRIDACDSRNNVPERRGIVAPERVDRGEDACVLGDDVPGAAVEWLAAAARVAGDRPTVRSRSHRTFSRSRRRRTRGAAFGIRRWRASARDPSR